MMHHGLLCFAMSIKRSKNATVFLTQSHQISTFLVRPRSHLPAGKRNISHASNPFHQVSPWEAYVCYIAHPPCFLQQWRRRKKCRQRLAHFEIVLAALIPINFHKEPMLGFRNKEFSSQNLEFVVEN
ncbi:hypothetical protein V6Z12_A05G424000 [Gossypium hirsutum]